ncbi:ATP-binding response regulator [Hyalangium gracile]|uniref:ATP-binding response regulator n=1 Tax=Hyalangium gracile TaxID=394092 RepID=UPI001CC9D42D|nr:hybrid sensor histidine kinase/response regulator [Hyalangium gracile]
MTRPIRTILLVEDSPEDRGTYRAFLSEDRECEYRFLEEEDAEQALEVCQTHEVDCVLLDYHLPGMNGLEFLRMLHELRGRVQPPVVMLTGRGSEQVAARALKSGAADYLVKSDVTPESLFRAVRNTIEREQLRRQVEAQELERRRLLAEYQQLAAVVANASTSIGFATPEGKLRYLNPAGRRLLGVGETEDVTGIDVTELMTPGDAAWREAHIVPTLWKEGRWRGEFRLRNRRTGVLIPVRQDSFLITGTGQVPTVLASVFLDISELKRQEEASRQRAEFEQYLAGIVGHDLRNPIAAITLSAAMGLRRRDIDERLREVLNRILLAAERAHRLIDTTLDFTQARLGGGLRVVCKPLDLHELTQQVVDEVLLNFPDRRLELTHEGAGKGEWDPDRIAQVITNLVTNALKYSEDGTPVRVRTRGEAEVITLEIQNRGAPIPAELLPRLFSPMKRGKAEGGSERSLGLGLFIVDHIVRAHAGSIEVKSDADHGTTFTVRLPRHPPGSAR